MVPAALTPTKSRPHPIKAGAFSPVNQVRLLAIPSTNDR